MARGRTRMNSTTFGSHQATDRSFLRNYPLGMLLCALALLASPMAQAYRFDLGDTGVTGSLDTEVTLGASIRTQKRDPDLIGKTNIKGQEDLCDSYYGAFGCGSPSGSARFVASKGSAAGVNTDNGDLNYDQWDFTSGAVKVASELKLNYKQFGLDLGGLFFYDVVNDNFDETHPNNFSNHGLQPRHTGRSSSGNGRVGSTFILRNAFVSGRLPFIGGRRLHFKLGNQILNQGQSKFLVLNSLNTVNPPNANLLHLPGSEIAEIFRPVPLAVVSTHLTPNLSVKAFYQFMWRHAGIPAVGSFFSSNDLIGAGGYYGMLSFGRAREDPQDMAGTSGPNGKGQVPGIGALISRGGRAFYRIADNDPSDQGEYGISLSYFARKLNFTSFSIYYRNLHSRLPFLSFTAADQSCATNASNLVGLVLACPGIVLPAGSQDLLDTLTGLDLQAILNNKLSKGVQLPRRANVLPVDTIHYFADYPEDIHTFGFSFQTSLGAASWAGEIDFRPNQPLQINPTDLVFAALQPAFPKQAIPILGLGVLPSGRVAVPDYVETGYRNHTVQPHQIIRGYTRRKTLNLLTSFLFVTGPHNPFGASQILTIVEIGAFDVLDMPSLDALQLAGPGTQFHHSFAKDGTGTPNAQQKKARGQDKGINAVQNPHYQSGHFADAFSWGYRFLTNLNYQNVFPSVSLTPQFGFFHDVHGTSPGPSRNFVQGRIRVIVGLRFNYANRFFGGIRYTNYLGGGRYNTVNDRDNLEFDIRYEF